MIKSTAVLVAVALLFGSMAAAADKTRLTLDDAFNSVGFTALAVSPDGASVLIGTQRADWDNNRFRKDLWLYHDDGHGGGTLTQLTQSGHDSDPQWSPDGKWIAFLADRKGADTEHARDKDATVTQLYLMSPGGGEPFAVTHGDEDVHAFTWSPDSNSLYFATRIPWSQAQQDAYKKDWKDVEQYRAAERGDTIFTITVAEAISRNGAAGTIASPNADAKKEAAGTPGAQPVVTSAYRITEIAISQNGRHLAFATTSISERQELVGEFEIYKADLPPSTSNTAPTQLTHNEAVEGSIHWAQDNKHLFFRVDLGSVEGKYHDTQPRLYWVDAASGETERWASSFAGSIEQYTLAGNRVLAASRLGTEVHLYTTDAPARPLAEQPGLPGTYEAPKASLHSPRIAFVYSTTDKPAEIYLAEGPDKLQQARPITSFNQYFIARNLPRAKPYRWTADDGTSVEGMLMYPPGKFEARNLPTFVLIHGGPADADGNHFETDWYQWDRLAATDGWLVFEPNYRGSSGYGDKFLMQIVPEIVSRPGKDILEGVDALVKDGIADPDHLAIGGYSYGGYMTNWLITQTTRFKAAVTGAGAVEHVGNWGNDDTTFDDAYFLGGLPWEAQQRYHDEAAIFQVNKVKTPTHIVGGSEDIRVAVLENYLLDHALHVLNVPSMLLIFPGEGHGLRKNPWHGRIKVREELKWLEKYGGLGSGH